MSLLNTERSICNKLVYDFNALLAPVFASKNELQNDQNDFRSALSSMIWSSSSVVAAEASALKASASDLYPGDTLNEMIAYKNMIDECTYLSDRSPIANIIGTSIGIFDNMDNLVSGSYVPEFGAASIGNSINNILSGIGIPGGRTIAESLRQADNLIECLTSTCGQGDPYYLTVADDYSTKVNDLYSDLNVIGDPADINYGEFDYQQVYDDLSLTAQEQANVNISLDSVTDMNVGALDAIDSSVDKVKELMKVGFF